MANSIAVRGEYRTTNGSSGDVKQLVLFSSDDNTTPIHHLPTSSIITVTKLSSSQGKVEYQILSLQQEEKDAGDISTAFQLKTTIAESLPEDFFKDFPIYQGTSSTLKISQDTESKPSIHVLISANSGTGLSRLFYEHVLEPLLTGLLELKKNIDFDVHETSDPRDETAKNFAKDILLPAANKGEKRTVLLLSGDGGIVDLLNGPFGRSIRESTYVAPSICLLPLGTGNALFHSLHRQLKTTSPLSTSNSLVNSLRTLLTANSHPLPTFTASFSPGSRILVNESREAKPFPSSPDPAQPDMNALFGAVVASYGFHSTLVADSDTTEYRKHGIARFGMIAQELLGGENGPHAYKCRLMPNLLSTLSSETSSKSTDNKKTVYGYILSTLVSNLEETFTISPDSKPLDGKLRTICFGNEPAAKVMGLMGGAYAGGKHVEDKSTVAYEPVERLRIDFEEEGESWKWRRCCIDGLIVAVEEGGWMEVINGGLGKGLLEVLVPGN